MPKLFNGEKTVILINGAETTGYPQSKTAYRTKC